MKNILGLDLGTNSIGFSVIKTSGKDNNNKGEILISGSRIIPMDAAVMGNFENGNSQSQTAVRTQYRGVRRLIERRIQRRERLHRVLNVLGFLPEHYAKEIDFEKHPGSFLSDNEPKLAWHKNSDGKSEFLFLSSFNEMMKEFEEKQPELCNDSLKVPYDWTLYYLRKKALTQMVSGQELAWILLNFNKKRGYYQLRGDDIDSEQSKKNVEYHSLKVVSVNATDDKRGNDVWYEVHLENGWIYRRASSTPLDWVGKTKEFIVTTDVDEDGNPKLNKYGEPKRSFRAPDSNDWTLIKKKTEADLLNSGKTVGCYIYDTLLANPKQKIIGGLIRTIERNMYKDELIEIIKAQIEFHSELNDKDLYNRCLDALYPSNEAHKKNISSRDFLYLLVDDVIFYQRPLKSKRNLISNCPYEVTLYVDRETGEIKEAPIKCVAKSNPLYQEFRLWQLVLNLRIFKKEMEVNGHLRTDVEVTDEFLKNEDDYVALFDWMNDKKEIDETAFLKYPLFNLKKTFSDYRWNYVSNKVYPCNPTRALMLTHLDKAGVPADFLNKENEMALWHILYSVNDPLELEKALHSFALRHNLGDTFPEAFKKVKPFEKEYGAYSYKAIRKLLPLMRCGKYWSYDAITDDVKEKINNLSDDIKAMMEQNGHPSNSESSFKGLPLWLACYVVYGRHSEAKSITKWNEPEDINVYLRQFKQNSLRNPIVEQVITETLRVVRDIWKNVGSIDEIHVELGREIKLTSAERKKRSEQISNNENSNLRIKAMLEEFARDASYGIANVRPYSPSQQEIFHIYEEQVIRSNDTSSVDDILKTFNSHKMPSKNDFMRYKLWLEQKYRSPYTGEVIPLSKLFTPAYEIEHIIPQSRYFDDSYSNKVICESEVNKLKDKMLGYEFIKNNENRIVTRSNGMKPVHIFTVDAYEQFIKDNYSNSKGKMQHLLMDDIPDGFIERQLNDSRYISKFIIGLLSNIVREESKDGDFEQEATSKNVISCVGQITDRLKRDWGINDVWNSIIYPRFERLNSITGSNDFGHWEDKEGKRIFQITMPLELQKGFNKKRIDHRHHAMDAIVIACATRNIVNFLNNESARKDARISRYDLQHLLCEDHSRIIKKPWETFTQDVKASLVNIIVSFKQNMRVINKTSNYYQHYNDEGKKVLIKQVKGDSWAIRKPLHKETVFGAVNLHRIKSVRLSEALKNPSRIVDKKLRAKVYELIKSYNNDMKLVEKCLKDNAPTWKFYDPQKIQIYYYTNETKDKYVAVRKPLDTSFTDKVIAESVTDTGIQKILLRFLKLKNNDANIAFSPDGIEEMNGMIKELNDGKYHQPIYKVRKMEILGNKFNVGETGSKINKYVEAEKGTNLFFAIYQHDDGSRVYETIPLNIVVEREKEGLHPVPETNADNDKLLFYLSPNDFVYIPTEEEKIDGVEASNIDKNRIYKMVSATKYQCFFIPSMIANPIVQTTELGPNNKSERAWTNEMIKEICIPVKVNRIGQIMKI